MKPSAHELEFSEDLMRKQIKSARTLEENITLLRKYAPNFTNVRQEDEEALLSNFKHLGKLLVPILETLGLCNVQLDLGIQKEDGSLITQLTQIAELLEFDDNGVYFTTSNTGKKKLKQLGIRPDKIISSGGPLFVEHFEQLDIQLNDKAKQGIGKKLDQVHGELRSALESEDNPPKFVLCQMDVTDKLLLEKIHEVNDYFGTQFPIFIISNWTS